MFCALGMCCWRQAWVQQLLGKPSEGRLLPRDVKSGVPQFSSRHEGNLESATGLGGFGLKQGQIRAGNSPGSSVG